MTQTQPLFGQEGSTDAGVPLPQPDTVDHHLAILLGMLAGDRYHTPAQQPADSTFTSADAAKLGQTTPAPVAQAAQTEATQGVPGVGVLGAARKYLGIKYVYGGTNPQTGLDCSGFVQRAFADVGVMLPRVTYDQVNSGTAVNDKNQLQPGDLVFFWGDGNRKNGHVGIYMGNGTMIDAPHTGANVRYDTVNWGRVTAMRRVA